MNFIFFLTTGALVVFSLFYFLRVVTGPSVFDRLIAFNGIGTKLSILLVLVGQFYHRSDMFVDIALALLLLNVYTTLLIARYVRKSRKAAPAK
ncbi:pH regulation protein F [bacterium]|nr:pH regulation protein F [bacterium]